MGAKDKVCALGGLLDLVDEDGAGLLQGCHDVLVVHNLFAHIDRSAVLLQRGFHRDDGTVYTGAVATRGGQQNTLGRIRRLFNEGLVATSETGHSQADVLCAHPSILGEHRGRQCGWARLLSKYE